jgi:outer membrane lipoprotein carrier protein
MFKKISTLFFLLSFFGPGAQAVTGAALREVSKKYGETKLVEMTVEKFVKSDLLGKETKYDGRIFLTKGKFRWENTTPEKTLLVFDGTVIWSEQTPPKEFGGPVQVARGRVDKRTGAHILISSLTGSDLTKNFKVLKEEKEGELLKLDIVPLKGDLTVKSLQVVINPKDKTMREISYRDDIGNLTTLSFSHIKFLNKEKNKLFKYQPPKGAQVTDL